MYRAQQNRRDFIHYLPPQHSEIFAQLAPPKQAWHTPPVHHKSPGRNHQVNKDKAWRDEAFVDETCQDRNRTDVSGATKLEGLHSLLTVAAVAAALLRIFTTNIFFFTTRLPLCIAQRDHKLLTRSQDWLVAKTSRGVGSYDSRSEDADERELGKVHDGKSAKCC